MDSTCKSLANALAPSGPPAAFRELVIFEVPGLFLRVFKEPNLGGTAVHKFHKKLICCARCGPTMPTEIRLGSA